MNPVPSAYSSHEELIGQAAGEFFAAVSRGARPSIDEFAVRYPDIAEHIRRTFPALLLVGEPSTDETSGDNLIRTISERTLGDFRIVRELGRGGMGTVFEAEQLSMGRRVALKVLPFAALVQEKSLQRFRNEVRAAAALDHPHIVSVYSVGEERGVHFFAMQLIRGQTLGDAIAQLRNAEQAKSLPANLSIDHTLLNMDGGPAVIQITENLLTKASAVGPRSSTKRGQRTRTGTSNGSRHTAEFYRTAARLGIQASEALQHAHDLGVLHRDIKPSNLMLDAEGQLYITDFGLARIEADAGMTMTGDVIGTLRYMAPEQALAKRVVIDQRADIYSLGATLYELLTQQPAFGETDRAELLKLIAFEEPRPLRKLDLRIPVELETIVLKAMAKNPEERYETSQLLADDLRAFLEHRPIKAKPASYADTVVKWSRRHRTIVGVVGTALVLLSALLVVGFVLINKERVAALAMLEEKSELLYSADMNQAYDAWDQGWSDEAQTILARQEPERGRPDQRGLEWFLLDRLTRPPVPIVLADHAGSVNELAVFPDHRRLASVGDDGLLRIWDLSSKRVETIRLDKEPLHSVAVSPDGRYVAAGSSTIYLCDLHERSNPRPIFHGEYNFESLAFSADGKRLAAGQRYDNVCLLSLEESAFQRGLALAPPTLCSVLVLLSLEAQVIQRVPCASRVETLEFIPGQSQLLMPNRFVQESREDGTAQLWNEDLSAMERELKAPRFPGITFLRSSPCGEFIAATEQASSRIYVFHRGSGRMVLQTRRGRDQATALAYSPDGRSIGVAQLNGVVEFFNVGLAGKEELVTNGRRWAINAHHGRIFDIKFIEAEIVATCGADGLVKVWNLSQTNTRPIQHREEQLYHVALSPDGEILACGGFRKFRLIDQRGEIVHTHAAPATAGHIAWSPSGKRMAVCRANSNVVEVLDRRGNLVFALANDEIPVVAAYSPDEQLLSIIGTANLRVCRADNGREIHRRALGGDGGSAVAFSSDGRYLAYNGRLGAIVLTDSTGKHVQRELPCNSDFSVLAFSPDGSLLASGHVDSVIRIWSVNNGTLITELSKHERAIESLAFSPDGRTLLSSAWDGMIRLWSVVHNRDYGIAHRAISQEEQTEAGGSSSSLSLSADGRRLAITYRDQLHGRAVELWELQGPTEAAH